MIGDTLELTGSFRAIESKASGFFSAGFFAVFASRPEIPKFLPNFLGALVMSTYSFVAICNMFFRRNPFQVIGSVVRFIAVDVMDKISLFGIGKPTHSNYAVHKSLSAKRQISIASFGWRVWGQLSKNFPTARNSKKVVNKSIFDTVNLDAYHAASCSVGMEHDLTIDTQGKQSV